LAPVSAGLAARTHAALSLWHRCFILRAVFFAASSRHRTLAPRPCFISSGHISYLPFFDVAFFTTTRSLALGLIRQVEQNLEELTDFAAPLLIQCKNLFSHPQFFEFFFSIILVASYHIN
jgi:hypothetical protein